MIHNKFDSLQELHAHLNGSLSQSTLLELKRYHADRGIVDKTNAFFDEFQVGAGDNRSLTEYVLKIDNTYLYQ